MLVLKNMKRDGTKNTGVREMTIRGLESVVQDMAEEAGQDIVKGLQVSGLSNQFR